MPPKKENNSDTKTADSPGSSNTGTQPEGATNSQTSAATPVKVKEESDSGSLAGHTHQFKVKFSTSPNKKYTIQCDQPCTVLEAIKSDEICNKMITSEDENIIIQMGEEDKGFIIATHFPCSCIADGEFLIVSCKLKKVEQNQVREKTIYARDEYSVFYIDTVGGENWKTDPPFRSCYIKKFKYLCVYGKKGMTVEEALKIDGRFSDDLSEFTHLSDNDSPDTKTTRRQKVDSLHQQTFKICRSKKLRGKGKETNQQGEREQLEKASNTSKRQGETRSVSEVAKQRGISVKRAMEKVDNTEEIYGRLREQFPDLKKLMESRFPGDSYQEKLNLRKENFGKIQQAFSEVHRVTKLLKLGKSVCKLVVKDVSTGTGFVLFGNLILTSAHLFDGYVKEKKLWYDVEVSAWFDYDDPETNISYFCFTAKTTFIDIDSDLDYAVLELNPEALEPDLKTKSNKKVPPGLLDKFAPLPPKGEACLIGHPAGKVKQMDPTCIIEKEKREQVVSDHLDPYKDHLFIVHSISQVIKDQGIENIMSGGKKADKVGTYHTFMYHGASGSPVFDARCRVFGLHTGGYTYGFPNHKQNVIEYAIPVLTIFERFIGNLRESGNKELLNKVEMAAKKNGHLQNQPKAELESDSKSESEKDSVESMIID